MHAVCAGSVCPHCSGAQGCLSSRDIPPRLMRHVVSRVSIWRGAAVPLASTASSASTASIASFTTSAKIEVACALLAAHNLLTVLTGLAVVYEAVQLVAHR